MYSFCAALLALSVYYVLLLLLSLFTVAVYGLDPSPDIAHKRLLYSGDSIAARDRCRWLAGSAGAAAAHPLSR